MAANRAGLIAQVQHCLSELQKHVDRVTVQALVDSLERCVFHCIRTDEFQGVVPLWALLERLERTPLPSAPEGRSLTEGERLRRQRLVAVRNAVGAVAAVSDLHSPLAKARAFLRQSIATRTLAACVLAMVAEPRLLQPFFSQEAVLRSPDSAGAFLRLCADVDRLEGLDLQPADGAALGIIPNWLARPPARVASSASPPSEWQG
ncbi:unnamed protein product, partial [Phaeothamnion confervicola]